MESGVLTEQGLKETLRNISQRRRQGVLEVTSRDGNTTISFVQGRVVEATRGGLTPYQETVAWFNRAGWMLGNPEEYGESSYQALFSRFQSELADGISEELFRLAIAERILENLYSLDLSQNAYFHFRVQMVELEKGFSPHISAGQLLLDFVELEEVKRNFALEFKNGGSLEIGTLGEQLTTLETQIINLCAEPISVELLRRQSLLSSLQFESTLLELLQHGQLKRVGEAAPLVDGAVTDFVNSSINEAFNVRAEPRKVKFDLLESRDLPNLIALIFLLCAFVIPVLGWREVFKAFVAL